MGQVGYRWYHARGAAPLFAFGHGLSFTTFEYALLAVAPGRVEVRVTNTGPRPGSEVVQLYLTYPPGVEEPPRQLKAFARAGPLLPGQSLDVPLALGARGRSVWDAAAHAWAEVPGDFLVEVGASSADIRLLGNFTV